MLLLTEMSETDITKTMGCTQDAHSQCSDLDQYLHFSTYYHQYQANSSMIIFKECLHFEIPMVLLCHHTGASRWGQAAKKKTMRILMPLSGINQQSGNISGVWRKDGSREKNTACANKCQHEIKYAGKQVEPCRAAHLLLSACACACKQPWCSAQKCSNSMKNYW